MSLLFAIALVACGSGGSIPKTAQPGADLLPVAVPTVSDPPEAGNFFLQANAFDLAVVGYEAQEYFYEGTASAFTNLSELLPDGAWEAEPGEQAFYRTRLVVHRPVDPARFNGSVIVEWLNVTSGFDIPPSWGSGHVEMYRSGHIWIGVSAQVVGIEGREGSLAPFHLKAVNPARYGSLEHPGDSFSYDIFSQVVPILEGRSNRDVLAGMVPDRIAAYGESQSAGRLVTYINAVQPLYGAYDGFMVHSRGGGSSSLAQDPQVPIPTPAQPRVRTDLPAPVITFQTETDLTILNFFGARQPDSDNFRLWEVAGTAHADYYSIISGRLDATGEPQFAAVVEEDTVLGILRCDRPFNAGPMHYVFARAVRALDDWIRFGTPPPVAPRLDLTDDGSAFLLDSLGNVTGGIRTPYVDAPSAILSGEGQSADGFCPLFGTTELFSAAQMANLYVDEAGFVAAVTAAAEAAVAADFLLPEDAEAIIAWAPEQWRAQVP
ncbi:MAG: alpha/beta hydrolase domain-containing protein [Halieaceae bacterium]|nr:alpha/beta hydrolase domain-containing protein [Halieaceae bacterium]